MTLGEKIKTCRQDAGMSQEKVAELVGVSRQAVTKWEANQSAPTTENLFKLAEIFGTTVDLLLASQEDKTSPAEQIYALYKMEEERKAVEKKRRQRRNILTALLIAAGYMLLYLIGRVIWCDLPQGNLVGWLFTAKPIGEHSYLYGWLLSSNLFWYAMALSVIPALFGKLRFSYAALAGFVLGVLLGMAFGPYPEGAEWGHDHYGWAIWGAVFLVSMVIGIVIERHQKNKAAKLSGSGMERTKENI